MAVITVDFDDTLEFGNGGTNEKTLEKLREFHKGDTIVIVTSRNFSKSSLENINNFLTEHNIFVSNIIHTNGKLKAEFCKAVGSVKHFDDCEEELEECAKIGIGTENCFDLEAWRESFREETGMEPLI
jgi:hypothetical protein